MTRQVRDSVRPGGSFLLLSPAPNFWPLVIVTAITPINRVQRQGPRLASRVPCNSASLQKYVTGDNRRGQASVWLVPCPAPSSDETEH